MGARGGLLKRPVLVVLCAVASAVLALPLGGSVAHAQQTFNVVSYGADPSGANDSTTAVQNAVDAAQAAGPGNIVYFPTGTYVFLEKVATSSSVMVSGSVPVTLQGDGPTASELIEGTGRNLVLVQADGTVVNGLEFNAQPNSMTTHERAGLVMAASNTLLENSTILGGPNTYALYYPGPTGATKTNLIYDTGNNINGITINDQWNRDGFSYSFQTNGLVQNVTHTGSRMAIFVDKNIEVDNYTYHPGAQTASTQGFWITAPSDGVTINGFNTYGNGGTIGSGGSGSTNITIENEVYNVAGDFHLSVGEVQGLTLDGCNFGGNNELRFISQHAATGVVVENCTLPVVRFAQPATFSGTVQATFSNDTYPTFTPAPNEGQQTFLNVTGSPTDFTVNGGAFHNCAKGFFKGSNTTFAVNNLSGYPCSPDSPPAAALTLSPPTCDAPCTVTADASGSSDSDSTAIVDYQFDWGDGTSTPRQPSASLTHTYSTPGAYTVGVDVIDSAGLNSATQQTATITVQNLVGNPGFECDCTTGWAVGAGSRLSLSSTAHSGAHAAQVVRKSSSGRALLKDSPPWNGSTQAGSTCNVSTWAKVPSGVRVNVRTIEAQGATVIAQHNFSTLDSSGGWVQIHGSLPVVNSGDAIQLQIYAQLSTSQLLLVDDIAEYCQAPPAVIQVTENADAPTTSAGSAIGYTVTVSNGGSAAATGVTLDDSLPDGNSGSPVQWVIDPTTGDPGAFTISGADGSQSLQLASQPVSVAAATSLRVHVTAATDGASCATYENSASVASTNAGSSSVGPVAVTVLCPVLQLTETADSSSVPSGGSVGYTLTLSNSGQGDATGVTLSDGLPGGNPGSAVHWVIDSTTGDPSAFAIGGTDGSQTLRLVGQPVALPAGTGLMVHVTAATTSAACAVYDNTASAAATNGSSASVGPVSIAVTCPTIGISQSADSSPVSAGSAIGFTITVTNAGAGTASGMSLSDALPAVSGGSWSISPPYSGPGACSLSGSPPNQALSCSLGDLEPTNPPDSNGLAAPTVHVTSATSASTSAAYSNTATVSASGIASQSATSSIAVVGPCSTGFPPSPTFNESTLTKAVLLGGSGATESIQVLTNDENALLLGVNGASADSNNGTAPFDTDLANPKLGGTDLDVMLRPQYPALFITDITNNLKSTTGDWQSRSGVRVITDGVTFNGSNVLSVPTGSADPPFTSADVGKLVSDQGGKKAIPSGTTISAILSTTTVRMSASATSNQSTDTTVIAFAPRPANLSGTTPWASGVDGSWSTATASGGKYTSVRPGHKNSWDFGPGAAGAPVPRWRQVTDATTTSGSTVLSSTNPEFAATDVGMQIGDANGHSAIPAGTTVAGFTDSRHVTLSQKATSSSTADTVALGSLAPATFASLGTDEGYSSDITWAIGGANTLLAFDPTSMTYQPLTAGHAYRIQVMSHDGDQTASGGDVGQFCTNLVLPSNTTTSVFAGTQEGDATVVRAWLADRESRRAS
jgi:uncharacterized repeat protein (TIGR01451 family)